MASLPHTPMTSTDSREPVRRCSGGCILRRRASLLLRTIDTLSDNSRPVERVGQSQEPQQLQLELPLAHQ